MQPSKSLLGERPRERALLIEYLHSIQDQEGCLPEGHLHALAEELRIPMAEVYEVATFYAHFDVVGEEEHRPPKVTIRVCDSLSCMLAGAEKLLSELQNERVPEIRVLRAPCIGSCDTAPAAEVGHHHVDHATAGKLLEIADARRGASRNPRLPGFRRLLEGRRLRGTAGVPLGRAQGRRRDRSAFRQRPARSRRRRLSDGTQMGPGARRKRPAADGDQR